MPPTRPPKVGRRRQQVKPVSVPYCSPQLVICASSGYTISLRMLSPQRNTIGYLPWPAGAYRRGWPHVLPSTRIVALLHAVMPAVQGNGLRWQRVQTEILRYLPDVSMKLADMRRDGE